MRLLSVHLYQSTVGEIQEADPLPEVVFVFGGLQDSSQLLIFNRIERLRLIQIDKQGLVVVFYNL